MLSCGWDGAMLSHQHANASATRLGQPIKAKVTQNGGVNGVAHMNGDMGSLIGAGDGGEVGGLTGKSSYSQALKA